MGRLPGFDYTRPFFYMVTLKKEPARAPFSEVVGDPANHYLLQNDTTRRLSAAIRSFHEAWRCVGPIECFTVMPNHIHLLLRILPVEKRLSLPRLVWLLKRALSAAVDAPPGGAGGCNTPTSLAEGRAAGPQARAAGPQVRAACPQHAGHLFQEDWHDWIVKKDGQLAAFTRYIRENPERRWLRMSRPDLFRRAGKVRFAGRDWFAYGNTAILELPVIEAFKCSRSWTAGGTEWSAALVRAERIGPGGAGIGTFMSPCEKECGNAIVRSGGSLGILCPEGFDARWHPTRVKERLCADGRILFLSLYPPEAARPDKATLHRRCHEMGALAETALATPPGGAGGCNTPTSLAEGRAAGPQARSAGPQPRAAI